jgi:L-threonine kinase
MKIGSATVRVPGVCGELVQGMLDDDYYLVTCPIDYFSRVQVDLFLEGSPEVGPPVVGPEDSPKAVAAVSATLAHLGRQELSARLAISNPIPRGKGMGSSSADVVAAIAATGLALDQELSPETVGRLALMEEPTDGVMFPGIALFDHRQGRLMEELGLPPPMEIVALDFGGTIDTVEFNREDRLSLWQSLRPETDQALELVRQGIKEVDPKKIGRGATISAEANQRVLLKPQLPDVLRFAQSLYAAGVTVGHSGTIIGVLLDAKERRSRSVFRQARESFPTAEVVSHFRLRGGGVQRVH